MVEQELLAQLELFGDRLVAVKVGILQVVQQTASLTNHHQQPTARPMIFDILLQMLGQVIDPLRQQRNLHVGRAGIALMELEVVDGFRFCLHVLYFIQSIFS